MFLDRIAHFQLAEFDSADAAIEENHLGADFQNAKPLR